MISVSQDARARLFGHAATRPAGGVGRFAIQLAKLAGAHVTGIARRTEGLRELGADEVYTELDTEGPHFDVTLDACSPRFSTPARAAPTCAGWRN